MKLCNTYRKIKHEELMSYVNTQDKLGNMPLEVCVAPLPNKNKPSAEKIKMIQKFFVRKDSHAIYYEQEDKVRFVGDEYVNHYLEQSQDACYYPITYRKDKVNIYELIVYILYGYTFLTAYTEDGSSNASFLRSNVIGIDIDNGLTIEEALQRCEEYRIRPTIVYPTFSHLEKNDLEGKPIEKFRMLFVLKQVNENAKLHRLLIYLLMMIFPECDKACKNVSRLWHGTNKGWFIIPGELQDLDQRYLNLQDLVRASNQWIRKNVVEIEREKFLHETFKELKVEINKDKLYIDMLEDGENINVHWIETGKVKSNKCARVKSPKIEQAVKRNVQSESFIEDICYEVDFDEVAEQCYLFREARRGVHWLTEPEVVLLTSNLQQCQNGRETIAQIIRDYPNYYNNDRHNQGYYLAKIATLSDRIKARQSCQANCDYWNTQKCQSKGKNLLSNVQVRTITVHNHSHTELNAERTRQLELLRQEIYSAAFRTHSDAIKVYPIEASVGKTTTVINALKELKHSVKTLFVTKLIDEQERIASELTEALGGGVLVWNSKHSQDILHKVLEATVVIITHEKYKKLCMDKEEAEHFTFGRSLLIIDEHIDLLSTYSMSETLIKDMANLIETIGNNEVWNLFSEIVTPLKEEIHSRFSQRTEVQWISKRFDRPTIEENIDYILETINNASIAPSYFAKTSIEDKQALIKHIYSLKYYFNTDKLLVDKNILYSANLDIEHLNFFGKRIILDASASFTEIHKSDLFEVVDCKRVIDHSNSTFNYVKYNTTKFYKTRNPDYLEVINSYIDEHITQDDKYVVFGSKQEVENLNKYGEDIITFSGSRGKNNWGNYNKAFIIHTQALATVSYIFQYLYYFPNEAAQIVGNDNEIAFIKSEGGKWMFKNNKRLHQLRITDIVSNFYQALKRIDRNYKNRKDNVEFHVLCNDTSVMRILCEQLVGLKKYSEFRLIEYKKKENVKAKGTAQKIYDTLCYLEAGRYKKKELREKCNISSREVWARGIRELKKQHGEEFLNEMGIEEQVYYYFVTKS